MKRLLWRMALLWVMIGSTLAQDGPLRIETGHPDLMVKVTRCQAAGDKLVMDLLIKCTNGDVNLRIGGGNCFEYGGSIAYDDEGNRYTGLNYMVSLGKDQPSQIIRTDLPENVPLKFRLTLKGFDANASKLTKVVLNCSSRELELRWRESSIDFYNVPVSRQGDW